MNILIGKYVYEMIVAILDSALFPTGKYLAKSLIASVSFLILSVICKLMGYFCFISWQGWLGASIVLGVLCFIERSEYNEILGYYRDLRAYSENIKAWEETKCADLKNGRCGNVLMHIKGQLSKRSDEG